MVPMPLYVEALLSWCDIEQGERYLVREIGIVTETGQLVVKVRGHWVDACAFQPVRPTPEPEAIKAIP